MPDTNVQSGGPTGWHRPSCKTVEKLEVLIRHLGRGNFSGNGGHLLSVLSVDSMIESWLVRKDQLLLFFIRPRITDNLSKATDDASAD